MGDRSRLLLSLGAHVVAVEPQPECAAALRQVHGLTVEETALGAVAGRGEIRLASESTIASMSPGWVDRVRTSGRFGAPEWREALSVPVNTLDELIDRYGTPGFCKIDVEGYESEVIAGLSRPLPLLSFEYTAEWRDAAAAVVQQLQQLAPYRFNVAPGSSHRLASEEWQDAAWIVEYLGSLDAETLAWGDAYARIV